MTRYQSTPRRDYHKQAATASRLIINTQMQVLQGIYPPHIEKTTIVDPNVRQSEMRCYAYQSFQIGAVIVRANSHFYFIRFKMTHRYFVMVKQDGQWQCSLPEYTDMYTPRVKNYIARLKARRVAA